MKDADVTRNANKDIWDKLDVVAKFIGGVVLVGLTIVLNRGANDIATSLQSGQLVQSLISDLAEADSTLRLEVALLTLDHSVAGDDERQADLVTKIAEQVFWYALEYDQPARDVAERILNRRAPPLAERLRRQADSMLSARRGLSRSSPDASALPIDSEPAARVTKVGRNLVFIQYRNRSSEEAVERLRNELDGQLAWKAPGIEFVDRDVQSGVRYFHPRDRQAAERLREDVSQFFSELGTEVRLEITELGQFRSSVPPGQLEVWLNVDGAANTVQE